MLLRQNGVCLTCKRPETTRIRGRLCGLSVDHSHKHGNVRGLLCRACNLSLGLMREDAEAIANLSEYANGHALAEWTGVGC